MVVPVYPSDHANYDPRADLNRDGAVDGSDQGMFYDSYNKFSGLSGMWNLSDGPGLTPGHSPDEAGLDNRFGWRGYWYDHHLQLYHVRNRVYDPRQGQFLQTDPMGFGAGDQNLYRYTDGNFSTGYDPTGLAWEFSLYDALVPGHLLVHLADELTGGGVTELRDIITGRATAEDGRWQEGIAKTVAFCWKTARDLRERGEADRAEKTECMCRNMATQNAQDVAAVQGIRAVEQQMIKDTAKDIVITVATAGAGAYLRAAAMTSNAGYWAYAGYNGYMVAQGGYQMGQGLYNGRPLQIIGGAIGVAGGIGAMAAMVPPSQRQITTVIGRMKDIERFKGRPGYDTWHDSGPRPLPGNNDVTWPQNRQWLDERIARGDRFALATDPATLPSPSMENWVAGGANGFYTVQEILHLQRRGITIIPFY